MEIYSNSTERHLKNNFKMKQIITLLLIVAITTTPVAQTDSLIKRHSFQLSLGLNQTKEKNINAKVHSGASVLLTYTREKEKKNLIRYNMSVLFSKLKTKYENASRSMNIQLKGDYGYFFNLKKTEKYKFYTGPNPVSYTHLTLPTKA